MDFVIAVRDMWDNITTYGANIGTLGTVLYDVIVKNILEGDQQAYKRLELDLDVDKYNSDNPYEIGTFGPGFNNIYFTKNDDTGEYYDVYILIVPEVEGA